MIVIKKLERNWQNKLIVTIGVMSFKKKKKREVCYNAVFWLKIKIQAKLEENTKIRFPLHGKCLHIHRQ